MTRQKQGGGFDLDGYNTVAERIVEFREKHPDGALAPHDPNKPFEVVTVGDRTFVVVVAAAYRAPDDRCPGVGMAWEPIPGPTAFTKDSELQNAETAAWGRAIVAALAADTKKGIASADEVRSRVEPAQPKSLTDRQRQAAHVYAGLRDADQGAKNSVKQWWAEQGLPGSFDLLSDEQADALIGFVETILPTPVDGSGEATRPGTTPHPDGKAAGSEAA